MSEILLSVAVVTCNRPESLDRTLKSLSLQKPQPFEVIISDDSKSEELIYSNKKICDRYQYKYVTGPGKGLYPNRNYVAKQCTGTHIRTMDDDHEFPKDHFRECIRAIELEPEVIWTIGEYNHTYTQYALPAPVPGELDPRGFSREPKDMKNYYGISCGATIYPRKVIESNILNSEAYPFGMLFLEYGSRLHSEGFTIKHITDSYIIHLDDRLLRKEQKSTTAKSKDNSVVNFSENTINSSRIFSMLMFSFHNKKTLKNKLLTISQIIVDFLTKRISYTVLTDSYEKFKIERLK